MSDHDTDTPPLPPAAPVTHRVLTVCTANVCRSPSVQALLSKALDDLAGHVTWEVSSAGTNARPGRSMCPQAAAYVSHGERAAAFARSHRSQQLTGTMVEEAGLVLVASREERAAVAGLSPSARRRTFTVREAAMMMRRVVAELESSWTLATDESHLLPTIVDLLHEQRGTLSISTGPAHASTRRSSRRAPVDLEDVHQGHVRRHKPVLTAIAEASRDLAAGIGHLTVIPSPSNERQLRQ